MNSAPLTLKETILGFFERAETKSPDFQVLLDIYGRERIAGMWKDWLDEKRKAAEPVAPAEVPHG